MRDYMDLVVWLLLLSSLFSCSSSGSEDDVPCLKDMKESLGDPNGALESSWNFSNKSVDICRFTGVDCWHPQENRILSLKLGNMGLQGSFPRGLRSCAGMIGLDLSGNDLSGPLPADIFTLLPYLTNLDLSYNSFSGEIPLCVANMSYLNSLNLEHNRLTGQIPEQIGDLGRLTSFSVADNSLSGPIPGALQNFSAAVFAGNHGLCGPPLDRRCKKPFRVSRINDDSSIGAAAGFVAGFVLAFYFPHWFLFCRCLQPYIFRTCG